MEAVIKLILLISILVHVGCAEGRQKQKHTISSGGVERGVRIVVMLEGGGTATLVCPKFNNAPLGSHGRECYLDLYDSELHEFD